MARRDPQIGYTTGGNSSFHSVTNPFVNVTSPSTTTKSSSVNGILPHQNNAELATELTELKESTHKKLEEMSDQIRHLENLLKVLLGDDFFEEEDGQ